VDGSDRKHSKCRQLFTGKEKLLCSCWLSPSRHVELTTTRCVYHRHLLLFFLQQRRHNNLLCFRARVLALVHDCRHNGQPSSQGVAARIRFGERWGPAPSRTWGLNVPCHSRQGIAFTPHALMHHVSCLVLQLRRAPHEQTQACYTNQPFLQTNRFICAT
jgi:hypothetical protein